jgi:hypothetical protein
LGGSFALMEDWGWNWADVEWEAEYHGDDAYATAYKLRDDIDMDTVRNGFAEQGYEDSEVDGYPSYSLDLQTVSGDGPVVPGLLEVVVMPDDHLLLAGPDAEALLAAATGEADALTETTSRPYSELFSADVESDGAMVHYDLGGTETAAMLPNVVQSFDAPWAYCPDR